MAFNKCIVNIIKINKYSKHKKENCSLVFVEKENYSLVFVDSFVLT